MIFYRYCLILLLIVTVSTEEIRRGLVYLTKKKGGYKNVSTPVVIWHGMGDSCCNPISMGRVINIIKKQLPGVYVHSLRFGSNIFSDTEQGFLANMNDLVEEACKMIKDDPYLRRGYNGLGFSQGGLFMRAVAQRCPDPPMKNLISIGGPQQGIFGFPYCTGPRGLCKVVSTLLNMGAYIPFIQKLLVQAQYWHDPLADNIYKEKNIFLADINNERVNNETYKQNLMKLKNIVLVKFSKDEMVVPKESEWFGFYDSDGKTVIPMNKTALYVNDRLGLKKLSDSKRIHLLTCDGQHLQMTEKFLINEIINKFLKTTKKHEF
uniref:Palmitoyl-protein thioesterase 1 n=1 Tax=Strongyloides venezuelensis TaxID=75913 RepID=A0A0K0EZ11_STRVS